MTTNQRTVSVIVGTNRPCGTYLAGALSEAGHAVYTLDPSKYTYRETLDAALSVLMSQAAADLGGIDRLYCDVRALYDYGRASSFVAGRWMDALDQSLYLCWRATKCAVPYMKDREHAAIVFITHDDQQYPASDTVLSAVCGAGIEMMTKMLASELASSGIRVTCVRADLTAAPEEIGQVAEFLSSPEASYITGTTFEVGGFSVKKEVMA